MSYPVAIAILLAVILLLLLAFRAGQYFSLSRHPAGRAEPAEPKPAKASVQPSLPDIARKPSDQAPEPLIKSGVDDRSPSVSEGSVKAGNTIVIVEYSRRADLVLVQNHFTKYGIETEIASWGGKYFLITKDRFKGFDSGSDGYKAKQRIVEAGALYKGQAPEGYETFAPRFFSDAYGKKIE
jgi:hypothetical protein